MNIWKVVTGLVNPITDLIDELHTSKEEKLQIKTRLFSMQNELAQRVMDYETRLLDAKTQVITAEAQGASWLQRSWRPITMLVFLFLVVLDAFGWLPFRLAAEAWTLLQLGLGGYVVGRSVEKVLPQVTEVLKKNG